MSNAAVSARVDDCGCDLRIFGRVMPDTFGKFLISRLTCVERSDVRECEHLMLLINRQCSVVLVPAVGVWLYRIRPSHKGRVSECS